MLKKIIIIGVGCLVAVCVMFVGIYLVFASTFKDPLAANGPQVAENVSLKNDGISYKDEDGTLHIDRSFKLSLKQLHNVYNKMLGWNTYSRYHIEDNWTDNFISELRTHRHEIESLADQASGELKEDLINAVSLLNIAMEEKDVVALLYVHRILHDLDVFINGYDAEMFMYTKTIHDNDRIDAYIAKKQ